MNPTSGHDTFVRFTDAELLAKAELAKINEYEDVVELLRSVYSALFDANAKLADMVSVEDYKALQDDLAVAEEALEAAKRAKDELHSVANQIDRHVSTAEKLANDFTTLSTFVLSLTKDLPGST